MRPKTKAYLAYIFIALAWGTTYLAIRIGVEHYPAFLFAGVRQVIAGLFLTALGASLSRPKDLSWVQIRAQLIIGFLLITVGNGLVTWAEKYVPSGVAALLCSLMPLFAVLFNLASGKGERANHWVFLGLGLGVLGLGILFRDNLADLAQPAYLAGMLAIILATSAWAWGSLRSKSAASANHPLFSAGLQLGFGGIFLLLLSPFTDRYDMVGVWNPAAARALWALAYLIVVGSILAYTAYLYALRILEVGWVSTYAYINPLVALVLGFLLAQEKLTGYTLLASLTILSGVYLVNFGYRQAQKRRDGLPRTADLPPPSPPGRSKDPVLEYPPLPGSSFGQPGILHGNSSPDSARESGEGK